MKQSIKLFVLSGVVLLCSCKNGMNLANNKQNTNSTSVIDPSYEMVNFDFFGKDREGNEVSYINGQSYFSTDILKGTKDVTFSIQPAKGYFMPQSSDIYERHGYPFDYDNGVIHIDVMDKNYSFVCDGSSRLKTYQIDFVGAHCAAYYRSNLENSFTDYHRYSPKEQGASYIVVPDANYEFKEDEVKLEIKADDVALLPGEDYTFKESEDAGKYILSFRVKGDTFVHITATPVEDPEKTTLVSFVGNKCTGTVMGLINRQRVFQYNAKGENLAITLAPDNNYKIERAGISFTVDGAKVDTFAYENGVISYNMTSTDHDILIRVEAIQIETEYFTVSFDSKGGTPVASQYVYKYGFAIKPADPILEGKGLDHWYLTNIDEAFDFTNTPITSNITLHAYWDHPKTCHIAFHTTDFVESLVPYPFEGPFIDHLDVNYGEEVENIFVFHKYLAKDQPESSKEYNNYLDIKMFTSSRRPYSEFNYFGREGNIGFHSEIYIKSVTCDLDVYISVKTLDDLSWSNIEEYSRLTSFQKVYPAGAVKTVVADGVPQLVRILDYGHDVSSVTNEPLTTFEFVNVYCNQKEYEKQLFSSKKSGDPRNEGLDSLLNKDSNSIYNRLPDDLKSAIKTSSKKIGFYDDYSNTVVEYSTKLFILASSENNSVGDKLGSPYNYYITHNTDADRIKRDIINDKGVQYWTRTPSQRSTILTDYTDIVTIGYTGHHDYYRNCNEYYGFAPAFNI